MFCHDDLLDARRAGRDLDRVTAYKEPLVQIHLDWLPTSTANASQGRLQRKTELCRD